MKNILLLGLSFAIGNHLHAQCPGDGLDIRSEACEIPQNLKAVPNGCSEIKFSWSGANGQVFLLKTSATKTSSTFYEIYTKEVKSNEAGRCEAVVQTVESSHVEWSVQASCGTNAEIYSDEIAGNHVDMIPCPKKEIEELSKLTVYPNPVTTYLTIAYSGKGDGTLEFEVYNVSGQQVLTKTVSLDNSGSSSTYNLDVRRLPPGTYFLTVNNRKDAVRQVKFVKVNQ